MSIARLRREYARASLNESDLAADPVAQLKIWLDQAITTAVAEPTAMTLATVDEHGRPNARVVLLKELDQRGLVFHSNYRSRKGKELAQNPWASLLFLWKELERQVRVRGRAEKIAEAESDAYFATRPLGSQLSAWASPQSEIISDREWLEKRLTEMGARFGETAPRPPHWGGYRVIPTEFEFWQGRANRLHDRLFYARDEAGPWRVQRLAP